MAVPGKQWKHMFKLTWMWQLSVSGCVFFQGCFLAETSSSSCGCQVADRKQTGEVSSTYYTNDGIQALFALPQRHWCIFMSSERSLKVGTKRKTLQSVYRSSIRWSEEADSPKQDLFSFSRTTNSCIYTLVYRHLHGCLQCRVIHFMTQFSKNTKEIGVW